MPVYEYRCKACAVKFEIRRGIKESRTSVRCPECRGRQVSQLMGSFTALGLTSKRSSKRGGGSCGSCLCSKSSCSSCSCGH